MEHLEAKLQIVRPHSVKDIKFFIENSNNKIIKER